MEIVRFVSAKPYLNLPDYVINDLLICSHGRKEVVVVSSSKLKKELEELPSDYIQPRLKDITKYLKDKEIEYVIEDLTETTTL